MGKGKYDTLDARDGEDEFDDLTRDSDMSLGNTTDQSVLSSNPKSEVRGESAFSDGNAPYFGREANFPVGNEAQQGPKEHLLRTRDRLSQIEKVGGRKNSAQFDRVTRAVERVVSVLDGSLNKVMMRNMVKIDEIKTAYQQMMEACNSYLNRTAWSTSGKQRQLVVKELLGMAQRDLLGLSDAHTDILALSEEECAATSWNEILGKKRSIQLRVEDFSALGKAKGGQVSEVHMLTDQNTKLKDGENFTGVGFFKVEDNLDVEAAKGQKDNPQYFIGLSQVLKRFPKLSSKDQLLLREFVDRKKNFYRAGFEDIEKKLSAQGKQAYKQLSEYGDKNKVQIDEVLSPLGLLDEGGNINMSRRNVATSRVAGLLGLGHLVAKSQTAEIYDEKTKSTVRGNLMAGAEGVNNSEMGKKLGKKHKTGDYSGMTGSFQRDLINLQVLDVLCGQADRHGGNIFYQFDKEGKLSGLQAIDNDASFGTNLDVIHAVEDSRYDRRVFDPDSHELTLPYMDEALAERILAITPDMLHFALKDLLRGSEIDAAVNRLREMQTAIERAKTVQNGGGEKRLLKDNEWNENTARTMAERSRILETESKKGDIVAQANRERDEEERELYLQLWAQAEPTKNPEESFREMKERQEKGTYTNQDNAIVSKVSIIGIRKLHRKVAKRTSANDTYFGKMFK